MKKFFNLLLLVACYTYQDLAAMEVGGKKDKEVAGRKDKNVSTMGADLQRDMAFIETWMRGRFTSDKKSFISFKQENQNNNYMELIDDVPALCVSICEDALKNNKIYFLALFHRYLLHKDLYELQAAVAQKLKQGDEVFAQYVVGEYAPKIKEDLQKVLDHFYAYCPSLEEQEVKMAYFIESLKKNREDLSQSLQAGDFEKILETSRQPRQLDLLLRDVTSQEEERALARDLIHESAFLYTCMYGLFTSSKHPFISFQLDEQKELFTELISDVPSLYKRLCEEALTANSKYRWVQFRRYLANDDLDELVLAITKKLKGGEYVFAKNVSSEHASSVKAELQKMLDTFYTYRQNKRSEQESAPESYEKTKTLAGLMKTLEDNRKNLHRSLQAGDLKQILDTSQQPRQLDTLIEEIKKQEQTSHYWLNMPEVVKPREPRGRAIKLAAELKRSTSSPNLFCVQLHDISATTSSSSAASEKHDPSLSPRETEKKPSKVPLLKLSLSKSLSEAPPSRQSPSSCPDSPVKHGSGSSSPRSGSSSPRKWLRLRTPSQLGKGDSPESTISSKDASGS